MNTTIYMCWMGLVFTYATLTVILPDPWSWGFGIATVLFFVRAMNILVTEVIRYDD